MTAPDVPAAGPAADAPTVLRVLVAEDDDTLRELSRRFVEKLGHTVSTVPHGIDAVQAALSGGFDVVLMDVHMPLLDGPQAARRIRAAGDRIRQPHIVALTAAVTRTVRSDCLAAGMDAFVTKPFTSRDLRQALQDVRIVGGGGHPVPAPPTPTPGPGPVPSGPVPSGGASPVAEPFAALADFPPEVRAEVLRAFRQRSADDIARLAAALATGAADDARFLAHRLHGAGATVGATALAALCAAIEADPTGSTPDSPAQDDPARATDRIAALRAEFDAVVNRIEATERGHPPA